jgi:DnaJ family protein C protein 2
MEKIEPVGPMYLAHARRKLFNRTFSEDEEHLAQSAAEAAAAAKLLEDAESADDHDIEPDHKDDLRRDAKDWKSQDHYRLLGLGTARWRANHSMIKKARKFYLSTISTHLIFTSYFFSVLTSMSTIVLSAFR